MFSVPWSSFVRMVLDLTIEAYQQFRKDRLAKADWNEDRFTLVLTVDYLEPLARKHALPISALPHTKTHTEAIKSGQTSTKHSPEIDIRIISFGRDCNRIYFAWECKRIGDKREYVTEGIARFAEGKYSADVDDAGMLGYVLAGDVPLIVNDINLHINDQHLGLGPPEDYHLKMIPALGSFSDIYLSRVERVTNLRGLSLFHLFLTFDFS